MVGCIFVMVLYVGLGQTVPELDITSFTTAKFEKVQFSMVVPDLKSYMETQLPQVNLMKFSRILSLYCYI